MYMVIQLRPSTQSHRAPLYLNYAPMNWLLHTIFFTSLSPTS